MTEFYPEGLDDVSLRELGLTYDILAKAADNETDNKKSLSMHIDAAIEYCDALASKSTALSDAVKDIIGEDDYAAKLNSLKPGEISSLISQLKLKAEEIGDVTEYTVTWNNTNDITLYPGQSTSFTPNVTLTDSYGKTRNNTVSFNATLTSGSGELSMEGDRITIKAPSSAETMTIKISVVVDGVVLDTKNVTVKCEFKDQIDWSNIDASTQLPLINQHNDSGKQTLYINGQRKDIDNTISLRDAYNNNTSLVLSMGQTGNTEAGSCAIQNLQTIVNSIAEVAKSNGGYEDAINTAVQKVMSLYSQALYDFQSSGKKSSDTRTITFEDGEQYTYKSNTWYYTGTAYNDHLVSSDSAYNNQLGLQLNVKYHNTDRRQVVINMRCLMDMFNRFYEQALQ